MNDRPASRFDDSLYPRRPIRRESAATRLREFMQWIFVALVAVTLVTVDSLGKAQVIGLASCYFGWAAIYGAAMYWESRS